MKSKLFENYRDRINLSYSDIETTEVERLGIISKHHAHHIPFEGIDPFTGKNVSISQKDVFHKMVTEKRGGYCFEHSVLLKAVLQTLGYQVRGITGYPAKSKDKIQHTARTHMALVVNIDSQNYLLDLGYGSLGPSYPLQIVENVEQTTPTGKYRFTKYSSGYMLERFSQNNWKMLYAFDLRKQLQSDFEMANWYISNHAESLFVKHLVVSRMSNGKYINLLNNRLTIVDCQTDVREIYLLKSPQEIVEVLMDEFNLPIIEKQLLIRKLEDFYPSTVEV